MFVRQKSYKMENSSTKWVLGHKITAHDTSGDFDLVFVETPAKSQGPPPHFHNSYNESFFIVEGEMEFFINGETKKVKAGESIDIPPKTLHTFNNTSGFPCKWINIHSPKGFRSFFEKMGVPINEENAKIKSMAPEMVNQVVNSAKDYDMIIKV